MDHSNQSSNDEHLGRTYVEDESDGTSFSALAAGPRSANSPEKDRERLPPPVGLPSGNEPVQLGSGTVTELLGGGGMAYVYKIWNERLELHRAVKVLRPDQPASYGERFETEAKITAKLRHPNIVEIHTIGEHEALPYIEMELIEGMPLDAVISRYGRLPDTVCTSACILIARALAHAHSQEVQLYGKRYQGIIHRDLKPANVMIANNGQLKLMDFGIARPSRASLHTAEGTIVGTMQYLSPEQLNGADVDCRTDIYSLGTILYEMLTGAKAFPQSTMTALMKRKATNEYRRLSAFPFPVSPPLAAVCRRCLQGSRNRRYQNASEVLDALVRCHRRLTRDDPEEVMASFVREPHPTPLRERITVTRRAARIALATVATVGVLAVFVWIVLNTGPRNADTQPAASREQPVHTRETAPIVPNVAQGTGVSGSSVTRAPQDQSAPGARAASATKPHRRTPTPSSASPAARTLNSLLKKYASDNVGQAAQKALSRGAYDDAVAALQRAPRGAIPQALAATMLLEAYVGAGRLDDAQRLAATITADDAQVELLRGLLAQQRSEPSAALEYYQKALLKPSAVRNVSDIRSDALLYSARLRSDAYRANGTPDNRLQALNAWAALKRHHTADRSHPRFREANVEMARIR
jgi:serine/threonine protein kinase